jgi:hypothetical protein
MTLFRSLTIASLSFLCSGCLLEETQDELATTAQAVTSGGEDDEDDEYFEVRRDFRRCVAPLCGGIYIDRINKRRTRCPGGTRAPECYVGSNDLAGLGLSSTDLTTLNNAIDGGVAVLRGHIEPAVHPEFGDIGSFVASEGWVAATDQEPIGRVFEVHHTGIVCAAPPCPSYEGTVVNRNRSKTLAQVDLMDVGATGDQLNDANDAMRSPEGLLVAGSLYRVAGPAGRMKALAASQFYLLLQPSPPCVVTGCSSQICGEEPQFTTCVWLAEYACYADATCETQAGGKCGWTETSELLSCIDEARSGR